MGLIQEGLRRSGEIRNALAPVNFNRSERKAKLPARSDRSESRIPELLSLILGEKDQAEHTEKPKLKREDGFEPFINPESSEDTFFVNGYNGNFAQKMELNRKGVERVLQIAHLEGQVFLTTLSLNRQKSIEANPDGSVSAKRFLLYEEKAGEDQKDNPLHRVVSVPQGWKIEIDDTKITEDLNQKKLTGEKLQKTFIKKFNQLLNKSLFECVLKEKLTGEKDEYFTRKLFHTLFLPTLIFGSFATRLVSLNLVNIITDIGACGVVYSSINFLSDLFRQHGSQILSRKIDHKLEYLMPPVEIDKVARSWTFLSLKGRRLVREAKPETK